ncbi:MAG: GatB/YqeY domain-containing protein [Parcubacteria group bacterium]|nr:GatB/YqeY domain-containing protein [Parcubacteria group bacterium]
MSKLETQLKDDYKTALKSKEELTVSVLRMLMADIKNAAIEKKDELNDEEVTQAINKAVKQRKDAIASFKEGGRDESADKEQKEIEILQKYLPEQLGEEEVVKAVDEVIKSTGASSAADFGKVMGAVMSKLKGQVDGEVVNKIVKDKLG